MSIHIHPTAIIEPGAQIADTAYVGPYAHIGPQVTLGEHVRVHAHVIIQGKTTLGAHVEVFPFASLGNTPQFNKSSIDLTGELIIGEKTVVREHVTVNIGTPQWGNKTTIGTKCFLMTGCHVGHDCQLGDHVIITNNVALGGHCVLGDYVIIGGLSGIHQFVRIGDHAFVSGMSAVEGDVIPYGLVFGNRAYLKGLNLVGLKRRGFERANIDELRFAYRLLFADEGSFAERVQFVSEKYAGNPLIRNIIEFIQKDSPRPICLPAQKSL